MTVSFASNVVAGLTIRFAVGEYDALRILRSMAEDEEALFLSVGLSTCLSVYLSALHSLSLTILFSHTLRRPSFLTKWA